MTGTGAPAASGESRRPALRQALSTPESKGRYVRRLFSTIADRYDLITVLLSGGLDSRWKRALVALADVTSRQRRARPGVRYWRHRLSVERAGRHDDRPRHHATDARARRAQGEGRAISAMDCRGHDGAAVFRRALRRRDDRIRHQERAGAAWRHRRNTPRPQAGRPVPVARLQPSGESRS